MVWTQPRVAAKAFFLQAAFVDINIRKSRSVYYSVDNKMKKLLCILLFCFPFLGWSAESEAVSESFQSYKSAILRQKGESAVRLVTQRTVEEYRNYEWGFYGFSMQLDALESDFVNVLAIGIKRGNRLIVSGKEIHI